MWIVTFYSFKGGVGRTMALMNVATELAKRKKRVLVVDFDLEAPGAQTYTPFDGTEEKPGIVDYVSEYMSTHKAPDANKFIAEGRYGEETIWIMRSGANHNYASKLSSIDWQRLYEYEEGYLLFEDLKNQWKKREFDYVLIDSRTGHTDVGGICTRQLPDSVVLLFFPNDQNIDGLKQVSIDIRSEPEKDTILQFCPSNVPDLDDEDDILKEKLEEAKVKLGYSDPASIIRHYRSLQLLEQPIFVQDRPKTRLAKEYKRLVSSIAAENLEDRDGVISRLNKIIGNIRQKFELDDTPEILDKIFEKHSNDGEVTFRLARIYNFIDKDEAELDSLNLAIGDDKWVEKNPRNATFARSRRAGILWSSSRKHEAQKDLETVIASEHAAVWMLDTAIERLREIDPAHWLSRVRDAPALHKLETSDLERIVEVLMFDRSGAGLAADLMSKDPSIDETNLPVLALIGSGRFSQAMHLLSPDGKAHLMESGPISDLFNYACADWGNNSAPSKELFGKVVELGQDRLQNDPNYNQCLALSNFIMGKKQKATSLISRSKKALNESRRPYLFSAWRYLNVRRDDFREDLDAMKRQFENDECNPEFIRAFSLKNGLN